MNSTVDSRRLQLWPAGTQIEVRGDEDALDVKDGEKWRPATDAECRAVQVEELARRLWDQDVLCCDSALVSDLLQRGDVEGFRWDYDDVEGLYPDPSNWTASQCREWLDDHQHDYPDDDNPFNLERDDLVQALEDLGHAVRDDESDDTLAEALFGSLDAEDWGDVDTWQDAVRDSDPEPAEVFEWWRVSPMLCGQLRDVGRVVLDNDYGYWWGRTCTGQGLLMDGVLQEVAAAMLER